jgi:hypothetical protein
MIRTDSPTETAIRFFARKWLICLDEFEYFAFFVVSKFHSQHPFVSGHSLFERANVLDSQLSRNNHYGYKDERSKQAMRFDKKWQERSLCSFNC